MKPASPGRNSRRFRVTLRDTWLLMREFLWQLLFLNVMVIGGGFLYFYQFRPRNRK